MSKNNAFWLVAGLVIGAFAYWWWTERQRVSLALVDHGERLATLEFQSSQARTIADAPSKFNFKWWSLACGFGLAVLKLLYFIWSHIGIHFKF